MTIRNYIFQNTSALVAGNILSIILSFISSIFLIRGLGSSGFGTYSFVYAFLSMFSWIVAFGMDNILVREASKNSEYAPKIWFNGLLLQILFSLIALGIIFITTKIMNFSDTTTILIFIASIEVILLLPWMIVIRLLQIKLQQWRAVVANIIRQVLWLSILIYYSQSPFNLEILLIIRSTIALMEVVLLWLISRRLINFYFKLDKILIRKILVSSWPLAITAFSIAIYHRVDRILIEYFMGNKQLGLYATADSLAGLLSIVPVAFMTSIFPLLSKYTDEFSNFDKMVDASYRWMLSFVVGLAGFIMLSSPYLIDLVYGKEFVESSYFLQILIWAQVAISFGVIISQILISRNLQIFITFATIAGALANLVGNWVLLPIYGTKSAAWVTLISYSLASILFFIIFKPTREFARIGIHTLIKLLMLSLLSIVIINMISLDLPLKTILYGTTFVLLVILFRIVKQGEIRIMIDMISSLFRNRLSVDNE